MTTTRNFVCKACGTPHAGLPTDMAFGLPDDIIRIPEASRKDHVLIHFGSADDRPTIYLEETSSTQLARDQMNGIDQDMYHRILVSIGHLT